MSDVTERTATDHLMDTVRELVYDGAQESVVAILEQQIAINTRTELENRALREFVAAHDKHEAFRETVATDGYELWIAEWEHLKREAKAARNRLAAEHGLPLPGAGEAS